MSLFPLIATWKPPSGGAIFDPATLALSGWWRANYPGLPWSPTASAGSSGSNGNLVAGVAPSSGTTQNGFTPAALNGTTQYMGAANTGTAYLANAACSIWVLALATSTSATSGAPVSDVNLLCENGGDVSMSISSSGFVASIYDGAYKNTTAIPFTTGAYHLFQMSWNSSVVTGRVDGGTVQSMAAVANQSIANLLIGSNYNISTLFPGRILEVGIAQSSFTTATFDNIRSYINNRYALSV